MIVNSSSFESPKPYLLAHYLKNRITALVRYTIFAQKNPISIVLRLLGVADYLNAETVSRNSTTDKTFGA